MSSRLILLGLTALVFLLAACAPPPPLRDETLLADTSVITGEPCASPCWRGITPGETLWRDAQTVLEDASDLENVQIQQDDDSPAVGAAWQAIGGQQCCTMAAEDGETVNFIFLRTTPQNTVAELIDVHGEPSYAFASPYTDTEAIVNLIYPDLSMIVFAFVAGPTAGEVSESSELIGVLYTTPDDMDLFMQTNSLHAWEGFAPYSTYSIDEGSEFEVTPSVTITPES